MFLIRCLGRLTQLFSKSLFPLTLSLEDCSRDSGLAGELDPPEGFECGLHEPPRGWDRLFFILERI